MSEPNKLKDRRVALGYSLRDVEAITNGRLSNGYLSQIENGLIASPSLSIACELAAVYAMPIEQVAELLGMKSDIPPPQFCPTCGRAMRLPVDAESSAAQ